MNDYQERTRKQFDKMLDIIYKHHSKYLIHPSKLSYEQKIDIWNCIKDELGIGWFDSDDPIEIQQFYMEIVIYVIQKKIKDQSTRCTD